MCPQGVLRPGVRQPHDPAAGAVVRFAAVASGIPAVAVSTVLPRSLRSAVVREIVTKGLAPQARVVPVMRDRCLERSVAVSLSSRGSYNSRAVAPLPPLPADDPRSRNPFRSQSAAAAAGATAGVRLSHRQPADGG